MKIRNLKFNDDTEYCISAEPIEGYIFYILVGDLDEKCHWKFNIASSDFDDAEGVCGTIEEAKNKCEIIWKQYVKKFIYTACDTDDAEIVR